MYCIHDRSSSQKPASGLTTRASPAASNQKASPALALATLCAIAAIAIQAILFGHSAEFPSSKIVTLVAVLVAVAWVTLRLLPAKRLADFAILLAVAGFGGLGMLAGSSFQASADSSLDLAHARPDAVGVSHHAAHSDPMNHSNSGSWASHHAGESHGLLHLIPMALACVFGCGWLCQVRPESARPRDWRHHGAGFVLMMAGMLGAASTLPSVLARWIPSVELASHVAMVVGMVVGTVAGFAAVDGFDGLAFRCGNRNPREVHHEPRR